MEKQKPDLEALRKDWPTVWKMLASFRTECIKKHLSLPAAYAALIAMTEILYIGLNDQYGDEATYDVEEAARHGWEASYAKASKNVDKAIESLLRGLIQI